MTERKPVFNPQTVKKQQPKGKKEQTKNYRTPSFQLKKKQDPNTRTIRFAPRTAQSIISYLFFGFFLIMCVLVIMTFGRVDTLSRIAMSKQVNEKELVTNINHSLKNTEQLRYEGTKLVERLFTLSHKDDGQKVWEEQLIPFLATGLSPNNLGFNRTNVDRVTRTVRFIKMDTINEKEAVYRLYYEVRFSEGNNLHEIQLILPVSYEGQEIKLIDRPTITNLATKQEKNKSVYKESRFIPKGTEVEGEEETKVIDFTKRFFELYVTNDEKLSLIANVEGLDSGKLVNLEPKHTLKLKNGNYFVQGVYTFAFNQNNALASNFTLEIQPTKESYFVTKMNGE
ncbi:conjugal transfer protein (plasmid) [Enterococcus faecalis]|uniref:conjugal transfer protein n=1 Tax=Enterococcus faecalis TaxID=1351 RepID=UPI0029C78D08|nr:conjugal transfer protein [Enterococcus faecalis]WPH48344.1 conjugal transfer protein [Enterococcus faecalis]